MKAISRPSQKATQHRRKDHKKSRLGCRNCKLRRVKCDEARPKCQKCLSYGVSCNYDPNALDLQGSIDSIVEINAPSKSLCSINQTILGAVNTSLSLHPSTLPKSQEIYQLDTHDLERLGRFQTRTILTLGTARSSGVYQKEVPRLACLHPYLMHAVITMTARHDRFLSAPPNSEETTIETYHLHQSAALFNQKLSTPIQPSDRDAVWATAIILGTIAISSIAASTLEETWPLKPPSPSDLQWLKFSDGKKAIWAIIDPFRPDSVFHTVATEYQTISQSSHPHSVNPSPQDPLIKSPLFALCNITDSTSTPDSNPYHSAAHTLVALQPIPCTSSTILKFLAFITHMHPAFISLLERKDPRALLLLACWYSKVCRYQWWIARRALWECRAICVYLERWCGDDVAIRELLGWLKGGWEMGESEVGD